MPHAAGLLVRAIAVTAVMGGVLWITGFFRPEEMGILERLRRRTAAGAVETPPPDTTAFGGEIVATDVRGDIVAGRSSSDRVVQ
jgi:hypothetical protein